MSGSRKNVIPAFKLVSAQSLASTFQSTPVTLTTATHIGFNCSTSGVTSNTGTFDVQHRVFKDVNTFSDWATLTLSSQPSLLNADKTFLIDVTVIPGQIRLFFTTSAGSPNGTLTVWISGDQV